MLGDKIPADKIIAGRHNCWGQLTPYRLGKWGEQNITGRSARWSLGLNSQLCCGLCHTGDIS